MRKIPFVTSGKAESLSYGIRCFFIKFRIKPKPVPEHSQVPEAELSRQPTKAISCSNLPRTRDLSCLNGSHKSRYLPQFSMLEDTFRANKPYWLCMRVVLKCHQCVFSSVRISRVECNDKKKSWHPLKVWSGNVTTRNGNNSKRNNFPKLLII